MVEKGFLYHENVVAQWVSHLKFTTTYDWRSFLINQIVKEKCEKREISLIKFIDLLAHSEIRENGTKVFYAEHSSHLVAETFVISRLMGTISWFYWLMLCYVDELSFTDSMAMCGWSKRLTRYYVIKKRRISTPPTTKWLRNIGTLPFFCADWWKRRIYSKEFHKNLFTAISINVSWRPLITFSFDGNEKD